MMIGGLNRSQLPLVAQDVVGIVISGLLAFAVRFDGRVFTRVLTSKYLIQYLEILPLIVILRVLIYYRMGIYHRLWRYSGLVDKRLVAQTAAMAALGTGALLYATIGNGFPRGVWILDSLFNWGCLTLARHRIQSTWDKQTRRSSPAVAQEQVATTSDGPSAKDNVVSRTLIIGAGDAGMLMCRELSQHAELRRQLIGLVDDDPAKLGLKLRGVPVLGTREDLPRLVKEHDIQKIIIAMPSVPGHVNREIVEQCRGLGVKVQTLPGLFDLVSGKAVVNQLREVSIEDLLRRPEVKVDLSAAAAYLDGRVVLVTGAGGSIGSEICRQVARFKPKKILLLGRGENSIFEIERELVRVHSGVPVVPIIADIRDVDRLRSIFQEHNPRIIFHAAAHKHVPLMEANPVEAISNNVFGTQNLVNVAINTGAERFVMISTDKAVNPTSAMGASKRVAEMVVQNANRMSATRFVTVRFGNVLGSRGSVIPIFKKQIEQGGPVTVTDPAMRRYFMTIPEAVRLVIQAGSIGEGGEILLLDMGEPVRIVDLARDMIRLSGLKPDVDIPVTFSGARPGEKLFEELHTSQEMVQRTQHPQIVKLRATAGDEKTLELALQALEGAMSSGDKETCRHLLSSAASGWPEQGGHETGLSDRVSPGNSLSNGEVAAGKV